MSLSEQELLDIKEEIEEAEEKVSSLKGQREYLYNELEEEWDCDSLEEAREKHKEIESKLARLDEKIAENKREIEDEYDF